MICKNQNQLRGKRKSVNIFRARYVKLLIWLCLSNFMLERWITLLSLPSIFSLFFSISMMISKFRFFSRRLTHAIIFLDTIFTIHTHIHILQTMYGRCVRIITYCKISSCAYSHRSLHSISLELKLCGAHGKHSQLSTLEQPIQKFQIGYSLLIRRKWYWADNRTIILLFHMSVVITTGI